MRLLMSASAEPYTLAACYARGLVGTKCEVRGYQPAGRWKWLSKGLQGRAVRRLAPRAAWRQANADLLSEACEFKPDVVWLFKGAEIFPETLRSLRARNITLVNYNADHPFEFFSRGSGNSNIANSITHYDIHITYSHHIAAQMQEKFPGKRVVIIPFGHEVDEATFCKISPTEEIMRACFLGNPDDHRARNLALLVEAGIPVDVFGNGWQSFLRPSPLLQLHGPVIGRAMFRTLRAYRVQLNFLRPHNRHSHNMRSFEVPACGGIMLAEDTVEHRSFFANGKEAFFFASADEMVDLANRLIAMPKAEADRIRNEARRRTISSGYSYRDRARAAFAELEKIKRTA